MINIILQIIIVFCISYLIGSIPTGYIIVKLLKKTDIRTIGSGSTGATNVKRILGAKWFFAVMLLDALKGFLPVWIVIQNYNLPSFYDVSSGMFLELRGLCPALAALAVIIGHSKSVFLGFTGGKSMASGAGTILALSLPAGLITAAVWGIITFFTKYVSLGSITAAVMMPILMRAFGANDYYTAYAALCAAFIILTHKENIKRLIAGTENKVRK